MASLGSCGDKKEPGSLVITESAVRPTSGLVIEGEKKM